MTNVWAKKGQLLQVIIHFYEERVPLSGLKLQRPWEILSLVPELEA